MDKPLFEAREIVFNYRETRALDRLSLVVSRGERIALLGANGSGKSTLLRILDALQFPSAGTLEFCGESLDERRFFDQEFAHRFRRRVGFVFQNPDVQLFNPTVFDELAFGPLQLRWPKERIREKIDRMLELMDIGHLRDRPPHHLSGGEKKRVALASVLILDPEVILLDEPTAALDPRSESRIIDLLIDWKGSERTVVVATHDLDAVAEIADRACVFSAGRIVTEGAPAKVLRDEELLLATGLIHSHRHSHDSGESHSHLHRHGDHHH